MSGYVASARIVRAAPRLAAPPRLGPDDVDRRPRPAVSVLIDVDAEGNSRGAVQRDGRGHDDTLRAVRDRWAELTFYLFSADSWR
jgi:hypothetical protein